MKIGILTFWKTEDNYGQLLQCYATETYLRSLGHEVFLVMATTGKEYNPTLKQQLIDKLRTAYRLKPYPIYLCKRALSSAWYLLTHGRLRKNTTDRGFEQFRQKYLNCTKEYSLEELNVNPPEADAFVVGSDQIWNTTDGMFFLSWAPENVKKVSIAASFGARSNTEEFCNLIKPWLSRFDLVTVREKSGLELSARAGRCDAHLVPDPTLLLRSEDYLRLTTKDTYNEPYLFVYFLGTRTYIDWKEIHRFAKSNNLKIIYVGSQGQEDKYAKDEPSIEKWLSLMANAKYVITNSFHGTVFAIQFHKQFVVYPITGVAKNMNDRLTTLLDPIDLSDRIYTGNLAMLDTEINYQQAFKILNKETQNAKQLLGSIFESEK